MRSPKILRLNTKEVLGASWGSLIALLSTIAFFCFVGLFINFPKQLQSNLITLDCFLSFIFAIDSWRDLSRKRTKNPPKIRVAFALFSIIPTSFLLLIPTIPIRFVLATYLLKIGKGYNLVNRYIQRSNFYSLPRREVWTIKLCLIVAILHIVACIWIFITGSTGSIDSEAFIEVYTNALYWTITTMTTVGYGDVVPKTIISKFFTMFIMIMGVASYGVVIAQVSKMILNTDLRKAEGREKLERLSHILHDYGLDAKTKIEIYKLYKHIIYNNLNQSDEEVLNELPKQIRETIQTHLKMKILSKNKIFENCSDNCLKDTIDMLEERFYTLDETIIHQGEIGDELFLLGHGVVEVLIDGQHVSWIEENDIFGEFALISNDMRAADITARSYCNVYVLSRKNFLGLCEKHEDLKLATEHLSHLKTESEDEHSKNAA